MSDLVESKIEMGTTFVQRISICLVLVSCSTDYDSKSEQKLDFVLCIGQSNMAGRGEIIPDLTNHVFLFNDSLEWEIAKNPLNRYSNIKKKPKRQKLGPSWGFGVKFHELTGSDIGLVVNARGGSSIAEWQKGTSNYNLTMIRALQAQKEGNLIGILWHQGEADKSRADTYVEEFSKLVANVREDLGLPELPVIVGQVSQWKPKHKRINTELLKVPEFVPFTKTVSSDGLIHNGDSTHFDGKSQVILGERYAKALIEIMSKPSTK